ncbi:hypothetical protein BC792_11517 [Sphingobacterium allocomposti]|jgi:hypothetical protein|uniref:Lipoprotein n=1 Tax=Sphingobacterium allocomposti TaxID=415956 RepID=A0A5S5DC18_9SPHI|nr:hypothetical protein [Sphingobacterium composti Yoo et al. 2007 non Ten et al. 2007]TYP92918.1 hypothetical protein BC792_11517 [Sphingobacterium composti Yoo et al. 2007 non Ten et al. 2007]HLS96698.1 hypothetical protein [Sphingobacterium sp.]
MKYMLVIFSSVAFLSCQQQPSKKTTTTSEVAPSLVGSEKDEKGCLVAAGYTWSKLKEDCIRPWEGTVTMNVTDTSTNFETAAFVLIDSTKQQAELFLKEEPESILLDSVAPHLYTNNDYKLSQENYCWSLIHRQNTLYEEKK